MELVVGVASGTGQTPVRQVQAAVSPEGKWVARATRTLNDLPPAVNSQLEAGLNQYGGLKSRRTKATGFFYATKVGERWWLVDPEGCLFLHVGVASVNMTPTSGAREALKVKIGNETNWAEQTTALLRAHGFNGFGAWSDVERLRAVSPPLVYTRIWNFMGSYKSKRRDRYPDGCVPVFDPAFPAFCDEYAQRLVAAKDDPWLLGHFSDNEMRVSHEALTAYLQLPNEDPGRKAAQAWLQKRHGPRAAAEDIATEDERDFLGSVFRRYYEIVSRAIKKRDPNHLYLGSRLFGADLRYPELFRASGPHVDVISVNYYSAWTPDAGKLAMWERESGKPCLISEFYAKAVDSGLPNHGGAGWLMKTQRDRGLFYQNFVLALLESKSCVGWHWFKYADNDPTNTNVDPSNRDSNKGIVSNRYEPYLPLLDAMKQLNVKAYTLVDYFDKEPKPKTHK